MKKCIKCGEPYIPEDENWDFGRCPNCQEIFIKSFKFDLNEIENFFAEKEN